MPGAYLAALLISLLQAFGVALLPRITLVLAFLAVVVERLFAWLSRYRRLNTVFDRKPDLFAAHVWIAMISIISRRLASLGTQQTQEV